MVFEMLMIVEEEYDLITCSWMHLWKGLEVQKIEVS